MVDGRSHLSERDFYAAVSAVAVGLFENTVTLLAKNIVVVIEVTYALSIQLKSFLSVLVTHDNFSAFTSILIDPIHCRAGKSPKVAGDLSSRENFGTVKGRVDTYRDVDERGRVCPVRDVRMVVFTP